MIPIRGKGVGSNQQAVAEPSTSRIVPKPVPESQTQDPRTYQLGQLRRRFSPKESAVDGGTSLVFRLKPSDPDFPFELDYLECDLRVPAAYPEEVPVLHVRNKNIPRGFSINVEKGWAKLVEEKRGATLLALTNALDKNLESYLSEQKVETVKLVSFKDTRHVTAGSSTPSPQASQVSTAPAPALAQPVKRYVPVESFTREQIAEAKARRAQETRQIETRMGRLALYRKSGDGIVYTLPIEPKRRFELPSSLQAVKTLHLIIPLLYPLQPIRIQLNEVESRDAEPVEELFIQRAAEQKQMTLMSHLNYLAQNIHILAKQAQAPLKPPADPEPKAEQAVPGQDKQKAHEVQGLDDNRSHIQVIPRPPEWNLQYGGEAGSSSDDDSTSDSEEESDEGGAALAAEPPTLSSGLTADRGTAMSFPSIELHGIELFSVSILSISVKCGRCKTINEVTGLKNEVEKTETCRKCASTLAVNYRQQLVHQNSTRAAFIDLSGCTVADMLPSTFVPVCAKCSTASPGLVSVRGETTTNVCRECHSKFTFKIPEVKFLAITAGSMPPPTSGPRRKQEKLGLHAGDPLPSRGACSHYRRSYRWFRFSCCSKVYPCDKCHDAAEDHINEWANRMICGWCSREQNYAVEACGFCGRSVIGRKGKGFWEGGKGTRDRTRMNRKDKRKFRRVGGGEAAKKD